MNSAKASKCSCCIEQNYLTKVYFLTDEKTIRAAEIAEAHITGQETPAFDPHKKADAENIGFMSGDQFTISETPVAFMGATIGAN